MCKTMIKKKNNKRIETKSLKCPHALPPKSFMKYHTSKLYLNLVEFFFLIL